MQAALIIVLKAFLYFYLRYCILFFSQGYAHLLKKSLFFNKILEKVISLFMHRDASIIGLELNR